MRSIWNATYSALYDRTHRVLCDAGINERMADELATQRTLAAAVKSCEHLSRRPAAEMCDDIVGGEFSRTRNVAASILLPRQARMEAHQKDKTENVRGSAA
jgi:hypothetical protein